MDADEMARKKINQVKDDRSKDDVVADEVEEGEDVKTKKKEDEEEGAGDKEEGEDEEAKGKLDVDDGENKDKENKDAGSATTTNAVTKTTSSETKVGPTLSKEKNVKQTKQQATSMKEFDMMKKLAINAKGIADSFQEKEKAEMKEAQSSKRKGSPLEKKEQKQKVSGSDKKKDSKEEEVKAKFLKECQGYMRRLSRSTSGKEKAKLRKEVEENYAKLLKTVKDEEVLEECTLEHKKIEKRPGLKVEGSDKKGKEDGE